MTNNDTDRCGASFYRTRGIINGALWYSFAGGKIMLSPPHHPKLLSNLKLSRLPSFKAWLHDIF